MAASTTTITALHDNLVAWIRGAAVDRSSLDYPLWHLDDLEDAEHEELRAFTLTLVSGPDRTEMSGSEWALTFNLTIAYSDIQGSTKIVLADSRVVYDRLYAACPGVDGVTNVIVGVSTTSTDGGTAYHEREFEIRYVESS